LKVTMTGLRPARDAGREPPPLRVAMDLLLD
jgi:hypothetical protein